jgi:hypothetical protein
MKVCRIFQILEGKKGAFGEEYISVARVHVTGRVHANNPSCLVVHANNPSWLGVRDQEDRGSKPARANNSRDPILKIPNTKTGLEEEWLKCRVPA